MKLEYDKRYKKDSYIKNKKMQGLKEYSKYLDEKKTTINNMIDKINRGDITEINIQFL
jgi:vacuolar-type H+-ATPase subunit H